MTANLPPLDGKKLTGYLSTHHQTVADPNSITLKQLDITSKFSRTNVRNVGIQEDISSEKPPTVDDYSEQNMHLDLLKSSSPLKKISLKKLSMTPKPERKTNVKWNLQLDPTSSQLKQRTIKEQMEVLKQVEKDVASMDKYVDYCTRKYKPFVFDLKQFMNDVFIEQTNFVEDHLI